MKSAVVFLADGFEEIEAITVVDVIRRANISCDMCSLNDNIKVKGAHGIVIEADFTMSQRNLDEYSCLILPGGMPGSENLRNNAKIINLVKNFNEKDKYIAAICAAPIVLNEADVIMDKEVTSYPGVKEELIGCMYKEEAVVQHNNIITSRGPGTALTFALKLVENLCSKEISDKLRESMMIIPS